MAKLTAFTDLGRLSPEDFVRFGANAIVEMQSIINGKIEFGSNIPSEFSTVFFPAANVDFLVSHGLQKSSINYLVVQKSGPCDIYNGSILNSDVSINLKSTIAGVTVSLILF